MLERGEIDGAVGDVTAGRDPRRIGRHLRDLAAPAKPDAASLAQRFAHRDRKAAGPGLRVARQTQAIGDDDQPRQNASSQLLLSRIAETIRPTME